ncbi:LysM peptidoglycan-binding domain-containing protein [Lacinutrix algicola]|uniref:LysM peptidoglycan-binding domain-containing protein n=1 Tax=Lacinutrix algicola TaxID=342954 RepID=UPI0006E3D7A6|nr:LysM peptidoglycan-binding domain-containing protein [Lacinutrix algicola]
MKAIAIGLFSLLSLGVFAQETDEEFLPIEVEGKEAFMSTKTGEFTFREHAKTDPAQLKTTASGVVYTDISIHTIKKGETLSAVARKNGITVSELKNYNKEATSNLKIGSKLKIVKKVLVKSSSPVISYAGEEQIIAKLRPGESPGQFAAPPSVEEVESKVIETKKTEEKPSATIYKVETSVKNPIFGLDNTDDAREEESIEDLSKAISKEVKEAKTEVIKEKVAIEVEEIETKKETKKEKLARLKAEMLALEAELEEETPKKVSIKETVEKEVEKVNTSVAETKKVATTEAETTKVIEQVKKTNLKTEISIAEKAKQAIASVRKTEKQVEVSKEVATEKDSEEEKSEATYYTVAKGNSLWFIAQEHNMTVEGIKKLNNLKNNNLKIGQKLKVTPKK